MDDAVVNHGHGWPRHHMVIAADGPTSTTRYVTSGDTAFADATYPGTSSGGSWGCHLDTGFAGMYRSAER
eukprot:4779136-Pyramimonas_sp.AAC.1